MRGLTIAGILACMLTQSSIVGAQTETITQALGSTAAKQGDWDYSKEVRLSWNENIARKFSQNVLPAIPAALLLLGLSTLFSCINFYSALPKERRWYRGSIRYLSVWVIINFTFASILLLLMLPEGTSLGTFNRTLFVYCIAATALPELGANVRLQLGKSEERLLDLYQYKTKVSDLILQKMARASAHGLDRDRYCVESFFTDHVTELKERVARFLEQSDLPDAVRDELRQHLEDGSVTSSRHVLAKLTTPTLLAGLLDFLRDEIERFRQLPTARLMYELEPMLSPQEAEQLVGAGIISRRGFVWATMLAFQRARLATSTGIPVGRLTMVHFSTRALMRRRRMAWLPLWGSLLVAVTLIGFLMNLLVARPNAGVIEEIRASAAIGRVTVEGAGAGARPLGEPRQ